MKYIVILPIFFYVTTMQSLDHKVNFGIINNFLTRDEVLGDERYGPKITVQVVQQGNEISKTTFKYSTDKLFFYLDRGLITFKIRVDQNKDPKIQKKANFDFTSHAFDPQDLIGKELLINGSGPYKKQVLNSITREMEDQEYYTFTDITTTYTKAPKKKKIRAYKTVSGDTDWTVLITNSNGVKISQSTFKRDTDRFAKSLYVQLNDRYISDKNDPKSAFNTNKVLVFKAKNPEEKAAIEKSLEIREYNPSDQLEISDTEVKLVHKGKP